MAKRNFNNETGKMIRSYADQGYSFKEICSLTGFASSTVSLYTRGFGYKWKESHDDIAELRQAGASLKEIHLITGKDKKTISTVCRKRCNLPETKEEALERRIQDSRDKTHTEEWARQYIFKKSEGRLEYVSGYIGMDHHVIVRCTKCGCEQSRGLSSFRGKKNVLCKICKYNPYLEVEKEKKRLEKERQKRIKEIEIETQWLVKAGHGTQLSMSFCECGNLKGNKAVRCETCTKRIYSKKKEISRRIKIRDALVDSDITVQKLFKRDSGICYLCGGLCDIDDKIEKDGAIICGDMYPSIDHVIPLARGGKHSWENVKLAHRICNSLKADKTA